MKSETNAGASSTPAKLVLLGSLYFSHGLPFGLFCPPEIAMRLREHAKASAPAGSEAAHV
jgi:hypothetical protein